MDLIDMIELVTDIADAVHVAAKEKEAKKRTLEEKANRLHQSQNEKVSFQPEVSNATSINPAGKSIEGHHKVKQSKRKQSRLRATIEEEQRAKEVNRKRKASRTKVRQMIIHQEIMNKPMSLRDERGL